MPASAVVKIATYTGTFYDGYDTTGVFGTANTGLAGVGYVVTFTYDPSLGIRSTVAGYSDSSRGGVGFGYPGKSPVITSAITVNGTTKLLAGGYLGLVQTSVNGIKHAAEYSYNDGVDYAFKQISIYNYPVGAPTSLDQNFGPVAATGGWGSFAWYQTKVNPGAGPATDSAYADFNYDTVYSVSDLLPSGGVPEPANWALMVAGLGMIGGAMRRRAAIAASA
ncbi:PEP-CTERM sorting domain-containing protein [Polymorphobacter arshaanensis]|uniref:PEP-CTERM sorting domain-containing protein n=2 Tax=Glacieibacterium arshaanense TaxID=2511025 RepID=A0A4Y9ETH1_9SPHN|nr:PEP-CTERM sorting domain-containing protein [Polymorphobacter arshaanensis]